MKRLSLLAVPLLMIGLLAGCGGDDSSSAASDEPTTSSSAPSESESSSAAADGGTVQAFCQVLIGILQQPPVGVCRALGHIDLDRAQRDEARHLGGLVRGVEVEVEAGRQLVPGAPEVEREIRGEQLDP